MSDHSWNGNEHNLLFESIGNGQFADVARPLGLDEEKTRTLLHAVAQLLIEKGVMTRDEFHTRVRELQKNEARRG